MNNNKIKKIIFSIGTCIIFLGLDGCTSIARSKFSFHPDTCELSVCELQNKASKNPIDTEGVEICACRSWNESQFIVKKGEQYSFRIKKITEPWVDGILSANPHDGWSEGGFLGFLAFFLKRDQDAKWYQLIGSIGKDENSRTFLPLEYYGKIDDKIIDKKAHDEDLFIDDRFFSINQGEDGKELYFYANDSEGRYFNNKGRLTLEIIRKPSN